MIRRTVLRNVRDQDILAYLGTRYLVVVLNIVVTEHNQKHGDSIISMNVVIMFCRNKHPERFSFLKPLLKVEEKNSRFCEKITCT